MGYISPFASSPMMTSKAIPIASARNPFQQGDYLMSSSPRSLSASSSSPRPKAGVAMAYSTGAATRDPYSTLGVSPGATKHEIKKAYRRLALKFHPDVCDGNHCTTNFQQINHAYETLINSCTQQFGEFEDDLSDNLEGFMGVGDDSWEDWEEWMGFEGAGTLDFSNHINPDL